MYVTWQPWVVTLRELEKIGSFLVFNLGLIACVFVGIPYVITSTWGHLPRMVGKDVKERDVFVLVSIMFNHILLAPVVTAVLNTVPKHSLLAKCQGATVRPTMIQVHVMFVAMTG